MNSRDEKIRLEILKALYDAFEDEPHSYSITNRELADEIQGINEDEVEYMLDRVDGEYADVNSYGGGLRDVEIAYRGIEYLAEVGYPTLLDSKTRYDLLQVLYEEDRETRNSSVNVDELADELGVDQGEIIKNVRYLRQRNCIDLVNGFRAVRITNYGREQFERYRDDGVEIPSTTLSSETRQAEIGKGATKEAENLFRDIVELAQSEVVILDRYAKEGVFEWIDKHVPRGVQVRVLTSGRVTGGSYARDIQEPLSNPTDVKVKELPNNDWDFHDRYVFRDDDMGWSWGHSFHDSGHRQHTANELKPINRDTIIGEFEAAWSKASKVI